MMSWQGHKSRFDVCDQARRSLLQAWRRAVVEGVAMGEMLAQTVRQTTTGGGSRSQPCRFTVPCGDCCSTTALLCSERQAHGSNVLHEQE